MQVLLLTSLILLAAQVSRAVANLILNIRTAQKIGLPYTVSLINEYETLAFFSDPLLRKIFSSRVLSGKGWPRWARFMVKDWHYEDKRDAHDRFGPAFLVVSPGGLVCYVGEAETAAQLLTRRKAFIKPPKKMRMLEPFGPNVVTLEGDRWRAHSRITTPPFHADDVLRLLWDETRRQVKIMTEGWLRSDSPPMNLQQRIYTLTMHTMSYVGFGKKGGWTEELGEPGKEPTLSLLNAVNGVVMHLPHILLFPKWALRLLASKAHLAYTELQRHMSELLRQEQGTPDQATDDGNLTEAQGGARQTFLTAVVRSNRSNKGINSLSDAEMTGNVFMFLLAGYDTTANAIQFTIMTLAMYPSIQDKVLEEIDKAWENTKQGVKSELSLSDISQFRYLLALMYEVMRVFPTVLNITRVSSGRESLTVGTSTYWLPPHTTVIVNNTAIHHDPASWPRPELIEPRRWLSSDPHAYDPTQWSQHEREAGKESDSASGHRRGTFLAFGEGPRACIGRTFARTEFVAFFSHFLRDNRVRLGKGVDPMKMEHMIRRLGGGSVVVLIPPGDVPIELVERRKREQ